MSTSDAFVTAVAYGIATLIVACACVIGLAVPMVMVIAGGSGAQHGVTIKSSEAVEIAMKASHVVFDKIGSLT